MSHVTHLPLHTPGIYMRYVRAVDDSSSSEVSSSSSSSSSSVVRLNDPTLLVWNVSIDRSGASVLRLRSPVTIQNTSNIAMEVLTITDDSACTSPDSEHDMASRRAFVISVAPHSTVSVPLLYASHCSSICVRPRENKDEEDHSFSEAAMFRDFNMKMMHAMPSSSGVARDCRPFHVSTSIRREKLRSHIVLSAPIVLRNVLPVDIEYSLRSTKSVSSKSFRPDEAKRLAASLECPHVTGIIKPGQIIHIHSVRLDSDPLLSFRCMWFEWSQEISVVLPRKRRRSSSKDSDGDPNDEILRCHDNRSKRHLPNTSPLLLHLRRQEDTIEGRHRFVIYAPYCSVRA